MDQNLNVEVEQDLFGVVGSSEGGGVLIDSLPPFTPATHHPLPESLG